ncbi:MAG: hypothetical protein GQ574_26205 [Crocinitomix sp.]|nr:hypothetical protein [Crocinitomix sp.]
MKKKKAHQPNKLPKKILATFFLLSAGILIYTGIALVKGELYVPGKHSKGILLHGAAMWFMAGAFCSAACVLLSEVVDHADERDNEWKYERFRLWTGRIGWTLFGCAILLHLYSILAK